MTYSNSLQRSFNVLRESESDKNFDLATLKKEVDTLSNFELQKFYLVFQQKLFFNLIQVFVEIVSGSREEYEHANRAKNSKNV